MGIGTEFNDTQDWDRAFWEGPTLDESTSRDRRVLRRRLSFAVIGFLLVVVLSIAFSLSTLSSSLGTSPVTDLFKKLLPFVVGAGGAMGAFVALLSYLEPTKRVPARSVSRLTDEIARHAYKDVVDALKNAPELSVERSLNATDRAKLVEALTESIKAESAVTVAPVILEAVEQKYRRHSLDRRFDQMTGRLQRETIDLARRGNLNLLLGMSTTVAGLSVLGYAVLQTPRTSDYTELLAYFVPRVSLVLLIEIFAYFFLKLYKESLSGIKYFQNELTNVESKQVALQASLDGGTAELRNHVVKALSSTERNFVLKKGETTVDLERERLGKDEALGLIEQLKQALKQDKTKGT